MHSSCNLCRTLTSLEDGRPCWPSWSVSIPDLKKARKKCRTCAMIHDGVSAVVGSVYMFVFTHLKFPQRAREDAGPLRINVQQRPSPTGNASRVVKLQFYTKPGCRSPWSAVGVAEHVGSHGLSEPCVRLAKGWLENCLHRRGNHVGCGSESESILPTRVIDLGSSDAGTLKLRISSTNERGRYVALSHCWGGSTPIMTTKANIDTFMEEIPPPLPSTFADAVAVTRALGIQYLWIDTFCIIQDSHRDWSSEALRMSMVYGGAYFTIAADAASNCSQGFLNHPNRQLGAPVRVVYDGMTDNSPIWARERGALGYQLPFHDWEDEEDQPPEEREKEANKVFDFYRGGGEPKSKLSTRGWVFQERALAARTLHFGPSELGWECRSLIACECSASSLRYRRTTSLLKQVQADMAWTRVIEEYTPMDLTVPEDRLVALAGVAGARQTLTNDQYIAGMWRKDLRSQLLWKVWFKGPALRTYVAPTWSWASVTGSVRFASPPPEDTGRWKIMHVECYPKVENTFGNCAVGAHLVIKGPLVPVRLVKSGVGWKIKPEREKRLKGPKLTPYWDSDDRRDGAIERWREITLYFFVVNQPAVPPLGLLLKARGSQSHATYERLADVSALNSSRRRTWSDESSPSEDEVDGNGAQFEGWDLSRKHQVFTLY